MIEDAYVEITDNAVADLTLLPDWVEVTIGYPEVEVDTVPTAGSYIVEIFDGGDASLLPVTLDGGTSVAGITFVVDGMYEGLTVMFGPAPLPDPSEHPNTVYFILPDPA